MNISEEQLVKQFGSPLYVYDADVIRTRVRELQEHIGLYPKTEFLYAVKANYNPTLLKLIISLGCGVDAVSVEEVQLALHVGCKKENIMFTGNNMTDEEMKTVHELGVLLNIGSLSRLKKYGQTFPGSNVSVRFNPNVGSASHETNITGGPNSKFGISFQDVEVVKRIALEHNLTVVGVHQHIGSGWLGLTEPKLALDVILDIAKQFDHLEFIDVGGGFGVPYKPDEERLDLASLGTFISEKFSAFCKEYGKELTLRFEPGRFIIAEAGQLLTKVNTIKTSISGRAVVGTDTGMHHLVRPAMYGSYHPIRNCSNPNGPRKEYDITGNICECADYFAKERSLNEIREGDILSIDIAGAYGMSMASNYQLRILPAEVLVDGDSVRCIRKGQTFDQLITQFDVET